MSRSTLVPAAARSVGSPRADAPSCPLRPNHLLTMYRARVGARAGVRPREAEGHLLSPEEACW